MQETKTVWKNTEHLSVAQRIYVTGGTTIATEVGVRGLSDAFSRHDAVDAHEQSAWERTFDGVLGSVQLVTTATGTVELLPIARGILTPLSQATRSGRQFAPIRGAADDVLGQVDNVVLERLRLGAEIEVPAGTQGIRKMMSDLSVVSGNEVALVRLENGRRVLTMGAPNAVRIPRTTSRVVAHTHPKGSLRLSPVDVRTLNRLEQRSTVLVCPREDFGVRVLILRVGGN